MDSEDTLFLLYTSGSTGKPKGIRHTTGGYLVGTYLTTRTIFDLREDDVYWCTADVGWVTGHSYVVYGPLANGATVVMYEGAPNQPHPGRFWEIVQQERVTILYTAPTAIRTFMRWGVEHPRRFDLSSLRLLGTVGEPINPEAWMWYRREIGGERCPIVDTWWQTETGAIMITPLPGVTSTPPGSTTRPFFGVDALVVDQQGRELGPDQGGFLAIRRPWPSMLRGIWGDDERYVQTYWSRFPGLYFAGDGARRDAAGNFWILGRVDDVLNVAGHRLSTMEVESALVSHPAVVEAAVVARPDELTGEAICAFVTIGPGSQPSPELAAALKDHVAHEIGGLARPAEVRFAEALPKTRSGKIMRRLLRDVAAGQAIEQDTTSLEDFAVLARLRGDEE
jgi:acetyl-CoA synthetase